MNPNIISFPRNSIVVNSFPVRSIVLGPYTLDLTYKDNDSSDEFGLDIDELNVIQRKLKSIRDKDNDENDILDIIFIFIIYMSIKDLMSDTDRIVIEDKEIIDIIYNFVNHINKLHNLQS